MFQQNVKKNPPSWDERKKWRKKLLLRRKWMSKKMWTRLAGADGPPC
jgi:hypothetical protein